MLIISSVKNFSSSFCFKALRGTLISVYDLTFSVLKSRCLLTAGKGRAGGEEKESIEERISILSIFGVPGVPSLDLPNSGSLLANLFAISPVLRRLESEDCFSKRCILTGVDKNGFPPLTLRFEYELDDGRQGKGTFSFSVLPLPDRERRVIPELDNLSSVSPSSEVERELDSDEMGVVARGLVEGLEDGDEGGELFLEEYDDMESSSVLVRLGAEKEEDKPPMEEADPERSGAELFLIGDVDVRNARVDDMGVACRFPEEGGVDG